MSDKHLTETEWRKFAKGRDLKDVALLKALGALDKAKSAEDALAALAELEKQADGLRKSAKGDKELGRYLDELGQSLDKERKTQEAEAKRLAKEAGDDEDDGSTLVLTAKMVPLVRMVRKGEEMQVLLAHSGKGAAVLLSRRAISPSRRKLLSDYLDDGTPKFVAGHCLYEEEAYTFVMKTQAAGLAKKLKAALLDQVGLRLKVRVRGEDPNDIDDDGEDAEEEMEVDEGGGAPSPTARGTTPETSEKQPDAQALAFQKRWEALSPRILTALKAQRGDVSKIRAVAEFVNEKGRSGQYKAALQGADALEALLQAGAKEAPPDDVAVQHQAPDEEALEDEEEDDEEHPRKADALSRALATWQRARGQAISDLDDLSAAVKLAQYKESDKAMALLRAVRAQLTARPDTQQKLNELERYLTTDEVVGQAERRNGFGIEVRLREPLLAALQQLRPHAQP